MVSEIYYFSGTGNCLATARMINEKSILATTRKVELINLKKDDNENNIKNFLDTLNSDLNPIKEQAIKYYDIDSTVRDDAVQIFKRPWITPI